ncbi:FecCD family ABC transporter permease [Corynebacterium uberis]|uniref:FecCD family ABC transporter permease n=1 Tax=Corynebacterium uberis TaxID=2883169 RepID=UPI001D0A38D5|nr:iron ABC transporter permease [Corynebacterium uberis]UDL74432.1 iron ABC transporter permease [Corynebacterium uberis]UDL83361.1 iron ABC transporter permease [Corynebacterium uberis]
MSMMSRRARGHWATVSLLLIAAAAGLAGLCLGDYPISLQGVVDVALGHGSRLDTTVVLGTRAPRTCGALLVGACLGLAGALTQTLARNPLASPDVLGITHGASAAAVTVIVVGPLLGLNAGSSAVATAALVGAGVVMAVVWLLSWRRGIDPLRLVLMGVAMSALLNGWTLYLISAADLNRAAEAKVWVSGSLSAMTWQVMGAAAGALLVVAALGRWLAFELRALHLGSRVAAGLGAPVALVQACVLGSAVALSAGAVAAAGPVGFVAFVAPHITARVAASPVASLPGAAAAGAALLTAADLVARFALSWEVPVGLVTSAIGAPVLIYLVIKQARKES